MSALKPSSGLTPAWIDRFQAFEYEQTDPATADAMTIHLVFSGAGSAMPAEADRQAILDFANNLFVNYSFPPSFFVKNPLVLC